MTLSLAFKPAFGTIFFRAPPNVDISIEQGEGGRGVINAKPTSMLVCLRRWVVLGRFKNSTAIMEALRGPCVRGPIIGDLLGP